MLHIFTDPIQHSSHIHRRFISKQGKGPVGTSTKRRQGLATICLHCPYPRHLSTGLAQPTLGNVPWWQVRKTYFCSPKSWHHTVWHQCLCGVHAWHHCERIHEPRTPLFLRCLCRHHRFNIRIRLNIVLHQIDFLWHLFSAKKIYRERERESRFKSSIKIIKSLRGLHQEVHTQNGSHQRIPGEHHQAGTSHPFDRKLLMDNKRWLVMTENEHQKKQWAKPPTFEA